MNNIREEKLNRQVELLRLYLRNMQIIKWRLKAVDDIRSGATKTTFKMTNVEFCILQIRKILELIALSALVSDHDVYNLQLNNIESMWNAKLIISDIERIHHNFYPQPVLIDSNDKSNWKKREDEYMTKEKFVRVYERCGKFLHENPLKMTNSDIDNAYDTVWKEIGEWGQLIINLLYTHVVQLHNQTDLYYIVLGSDDERPCGNIFTSDFSEND